MSAEELYQKTILDHYRNPRNYGEIENPGIFVKESNPVCGDKLELFLLIGEDEVIDKIHFTGRGCALSMAAASMMTELVVRKSFDEARGLIAQVSDFFNGKAGAKIDPLGDMSALKGVMNFSVRIKCVLLCWQALERAIQEWENLLSS